MRYIFCTSTARCYSSCDGVLIFVAEMKFREQIHYCCPTNKMIGKTRAISILTNNVRDHAIRVGPHTAASEILVELNLVILKIGCALIKYYSCRILLAKSSQINHGPHLKLFSKKLTNLPYFSLAINLMLRVWATLLLLFRYLSKK